MIRPVPLLCVLTVAVCSVGAQSSQVVDELLEQESAQLGPTAYIVLTAAGLLSEGAGYEEAVAMVEERRMLRRNLDPQSEVRLGRFSKLVLEAFDLKGGLMYRITGLPRYAARELAFRDYYRGSSASGREISGEFVIRVVGRVLERTEVPAEPIQNR